MGSASDGPYTANMGDDWGAYMFDIIGMNYDELYEFQIEFASYGNIGYGYKIFIDYILGDSAPPTLKIDAPVGGSITGSGTSTMYKGYTATTVQLNYEDGAYIDEGDPYLRYCWSSTNTASCASWKSMDITSITENKKFYATIPLPDTAGTWYLIVDGYLSDHMNKYIDNNTNINGVTYKSYTNRVFKFVVEDNLKITKFEMTANDTTSNAGYSKTTKLDYKIELSSPDKVTSCVITNTVNGTTTTVYTGTKCLTSGTVTVQATNGTHILTLTAKVNSATATSKAIEVATGKYEIIVDTIAPKLKLAGVEPDTSSTSVSPTTTISLAPGSSMAFSVEDANLNSKNKPAYFYFFATKELSDSEILTYIAGVNSAVTPGNNVPQKVMETNNGYYMYFYISKSDKSYEDLAGHKVDMIEVGSYLTRKFYIKPTYTPVSGYKDPLIDDITTYKASATNCSSGCNYKNYGGSNELKYYSEYQSSGNNNMTLHDSSERKNAYFMDYTNKMIVISMNETSASSSVSFNSLLSKMGLLFVGGVNQNFSDATSKGGNVIVSNKNGAKTEIAIVVVVYSPQVGNSSNSGSSLTINKGEEIGENIGVSFVSQTDGGLSIDTLITLNGVKVKKVDTNVSGVYSVKQVATDRLGRSTTVVREIIVKDNGEVKEEVVKEQEIKEKEEILVPVVNNVEKVNSRVVNEDRVETRSVEVNKIDMMTNKEVKFKGYSKKKEIKKNKKEKFSFKLFSKYFFKIYDG